MTFVLPSRADQDAAIADIKGYIDSWSRVPGMPPRPEGYAYTPHEFMLKFGRPYYIDERTYAGKRHTAKQCYANAGRLANGTLIYVEGKLLTNGVVIDHAWLSHSEEPNRVIDPTLAPHAGIGAYFGIPFWHSHLIEVTNEHGTWGVLDFPKNLALLKEGVDLSKVIYD